MEQLGNLIGISKATLYGYSNADPKRRRHGAFGHAVSFPTLYVLRALVAALPATTAALWSPHAPSE